MRKHTTKLMTRLAEAPVFVAGLLLAPAERTAASGQSVLDRSTKFCQWVVLAGCHNEVCSYSNGSGPRQAQTDGHAASSDPQGRHASRGMSAKMALMQERKRAGGTCTGLHCTLGRSRASLAPVSSSSYVVTCALAIAHRAASRTAVFMSAGCGIVA